MCILCGESTTLPQTASPLEGGFSARFPRVWVALGAGLGPLVMQDWESCPGPVPAASPSPTCCSDLPLCSRRLSRGGAGHSAHLRKASTARPFLSRPTHHCPDSPKIKPRSTCAHAPLLSPCMHVCPHAPMLTPCMHLCVPSTPGHLCTHVCTFTHMCPS